jgi:putative flippase GtrA
MDSEKRNALREFAFFNLIGALNTILGLAVYFLLIYVGVHYIAALSIDYIIGIAFSFIMNKTYTFHIGETLSSAMISKMIGVYGLIFGINFIFLTILVEFFHIDAYLGQIISCGFLSILTFLFQKYYVFHNIRT